MDKKWVSNIDISTQTWRKLAIASRLSQQGKKKKKKGICGTRCSLSQQVAKLEGCVINEILKYTQKEKMEEDCVGNRYMIFAEDEI